MARCGRLVVSASSLITGSILFGLLLIIMGLLIGRRGSASSAAAVATPSWRLPPAASSPRCIEAVL
jgi:hypothetical protein